eukprot:TRINITY_DN11093_c0_g1_i1.p1 TRINITY_DN11093_c0_g1~~TRINITY_DN11093_c0_g1_i1.p1  ORF type:complete len:114 (+),score=24.30 TRINITY_DN11093_c0_g1_i1:32-373(+)
MDKEESRFKNVLDVTSTKGRGMNFFRFGLPILTLCALGLYGISFIMEDKHERDVARNSGRAVSRWRTDEIAAEKARARAEPFDFDAELKKLEAHDYSRIKYKPVPTPPGFDDE